MNKKSAKELTEIVHKEDAEWNLIIKEKARMKYQELASYGQDTEGFPESSSFIYGYFLGYKEGIKELQAENAILVQEIEKFKGYLEAWDLKD